MILARSNLQSHTGMLPIAKGRRSLVIRTQLGTIDRKCVVNIITFFALPRLGIVDWGNGKIYEDRNFGSV